MGTPQELIAGRYRLLRTIAAGGMGVVWEARDELLERPVAIKQLRTRIGVPDEETAFAKQRAMREARITARLHHPNAVVVFDSVEHEGEPCLVMQYVPSQPLSAVLRQHGSLPIGEVARIGAQIAAALAAAHDLGIVHRDVKPGNILIRDEDRAAMLSDFGISHALGDATVTSTALVHGTPAYLAPEVARGEEASFASDVFSLGSTLYATSEGEAPFGESPNSIAVLHRVASGGFPAPARSGALGALLLQMMADDPEARPAMRDVALRLAQLEGAEPGSAAPALPLVTSADMDTALIDTGRPTSVLEPATTEEEDEGVPTEESEPVRTLAVPAVPAVPEIDSGAAAADRAPGPPPPAPPASTDRSRRRGRVAIGALIVAVLLAGGGLGLARLVQPGASAPRATAAAPASSPAPTAASRSTTTPSASLSASATSPAPGPTPTAPRPTTTPTPTSSPRPTTSSSPATAALTAAGMTAAISRYYGLVPGDLDDAWPLLTVTYQSDHAGGRAAYDRFWAPISGVSVSFVRATGADTVRATITYRYRSSRVVTEDTGFRLVADGSAVKIADSTVVSSSG